MGLEPTIRGLGSRYTFPLGHWGGYYEKFSSKIYTFLANVNNQNKPLLNLCKLGAFTAN